MKKGLAVLAVLALLGAGVGVSTLSALFTIFGGAAAAAAATCFTPVGGTLASASGPVRLPVTGGYTVTSDYGMRVHPLTGVYKLHDGLDLATLPAGGTVVAASAGTVTATPTDRAGGTMVVLDHGAATTTEYLHLASRLVGIGDTVSAGQPLGVEGSTGFSTGVHLHFTVRQGGQPVNARDWLTSHGVPLPAVGQTSTAPPTTATTTGALRERSTSAAASTGVPTRVGPWSGEQVVNAGHIITAGQDRGLDEWTITVAVMTGMGESGLRNVPHGDNVRSDTIGVFQEGPERGSDEDRMNPYAAAGIFYTHLLRVPDYHQLAPTIAAHHAQSNADPYHYEPFWPQAVQLVAVLTANPDLLTSLPSAGGAAPCAAPSGPSPPGPDGNCPPTGLPAETGLQPAALRTLRCVKQAFPAISTFHGVGERAGGGEHPVGAAVDAMIPSYRTGQGRAYGQQVADWVRANAATLGVQYVIYDMRIWNIDRDREGWRPYTRYGDTPGDTLAHRDHIHVTSSRN